MHRNQKILLIVTALFILFNISHLPAGRAASAFRSVETSIEQEIGYYNYYSLNRQKKPAHLTDADSRRIQAVFSRLIANSPRRRELDFNLTVVEDPSINAFALPGGYIFINSGLLSFAQSDGEIAGVLGHEIGHVDRKHAMKALYRTVGMTAIWSMIMHKNDSKHKTALNRVAGVSMTLVQLGYSREAEFEADEYGMRMMLLSGYRKNDLLNFWKRVAAEEGDQKMPGFFQILSTHPPLTERIQRIENLQ